MKIRMKKCGETLTVNDSYGLRMIEQGKASFVQEKPAARKTASAPKEAETK